MSEGIYNCGSNFIKQEQMLRDGSDVERPITHRNTACLHKSVQSQTLTQSQGREGQDSRACAVVYNVLAAEITHV